MNKNYKVFCIGLNKSGTTSLHLAFQKLGLKSVHFKDDNGNNIKDIIKNNSDNGYKLLNGIEHYDAYSDWNHPSTNILFKDLDKQYPNSKFILNTRNLKDWLLSRENHVKRIKNLNELQKKYPKSPWYGIDINAWKVEYHEHHNNVFDYFKGRESDLLVFDVTKSDEWNKLCDFLNLEIPKIKFPKTNTATQFSLMNRVRRRLKKLLKTKTTNKNKRL